MKNFTITLLFLSALFLSTNLYAQCPTGSVTLTTQAEVDQFVADYPNCEVIEGSLTINGTDISDISGISSLKNVNGLFSIRQTNVVEFKFDKLKTTHGLYFYINDKLKSVSASNLTTLDGQLFFERNSILKQVDLPMLSSLGTRIKILNNAKLENLNANNLSTFTNVVDINISKNPKLISIHFDKVTGETNRILVENNTSLQQVLLPNIKRANDNITCVGNDALQIIDLSNLIYANGVRISGGLLTQVKLSKLESIREDFSISGTAIEHLDLNTLAGGGTDDPAFVIAGNAKLISINLENFARANNCQIKDNILLETINLKNLTSIGVSIGNDLVITGNTSLITLNLDKLKTVVGSGADLRIEDTKLTSLNLGQVTSVGEGVLSLQNNAELIQFDLSSLTVVRHIEINENSKLTNLNSLQSLTTIAGNLIITNNPSLTDCSGLCTIFGNNGTITGSVTIENNPSACSSQSEVVTACNAPQCPTGDVTLTTQAEVDQFVVDYPNCEVIEGNLKIDGLTITDLSGLSKITKLETGELTVQNTNVTNINFENLTAIGGDLRFIKNAVLEQVNLENLATIDFGEVRFYQNPKLKEISLNKLTSQIIDLHIRENASLTTLSLCSLSSTEGQFYVHKNTVLNTVCFDKLSTVGGNFEITQSNLTTVSTFQNLKTIELELHIQDNANLTSLDFSSLQTIGMSIYVEKNSTLSQLNLDHLATLGMEMTFSDNPSLTTVSINSLKSDIQSISFYRNPSLVSLSLCQLPSVDDITLNDNTSLNALCFDSLLKINGRLDISKSALEDVDAFQNVITAGDIYFNNNPGLASLNFNHLTTATSDIFISFNENLTTLDFCNVTLVNGMLSLTQNTALNSICFDELKQVSAILNISHSSLSNLDTFQNLTTAGELGVFENLNLTDCSGLCNILNNNGVSGAITINNNPSECSSQSEVESSCAALGVDDILTSNFIVFPNPTQGILNLTGDLTGTTYSITDIMGRVLKKDVIKINTIDISTFKSGVYYLSVFKDNTTLVKTVIKQ